jgi:predicted tellurium resistance membrane protein TerC
VGRLPAEQRDLARRAGLALAMVSRLALLFALSWIMQLTEPLFEAMGRGVSGRDLILLGGGLFLIWKATHEVHGALEGEEHAGGDASAAARANFASILVQIAIIDVVFSLDSVITAVGLVDEIGVMVTAIVLTVALMMMAAKPIGDFVDRHPTVKMLALSFLILVGMALVAEGAGFHIPKGYIYFAMAFSVAVEMLNIRVRTRRKAVQLRKPDTPAAG